MSKSANFIWRYFVTYLQYFLEISPYVCGRLRIYELYKLVLKEYLTLKNNDQGSMLARKMKKKTQNIMTTLESDLGPVDKWPCDV